MRRVIAATLGLVAGCYAPSPPAGVPCDPTAPACPRGQSCTAGPTGYACQIGGAGPPFDAPMDEWFDAPDDAPDDAPTDAPTDGPIADAAPDAFVDPDLDGDTVPNASDNCPTLANTNQYNEDGDKFGDACDPCPPIAGDSPADGDGDGVADACDPRPTMGGDSIALFEGFQGGIPATWTKVGTWTAGGGSVSGDSTGGGKAMLVAPGPTTGRHTVTASMTVVTIAPSTDASAGVIESYDTAAKTGVFCHLTAWSPTNEPLVLNRVSSAGAILATTAFDITENTTYTLTETRDGMGRTCMGVNGATAVMATGTAPESPAAPTAGFRVVRTKATYAWLMIVAH